MNQKSRNDKAFTIVELLVVILIISMLVVFVAPRMFRGLGEAKKDISKAQMANIESSIYRFYLDCGRFPDEGVGLDELVEEPADCEDKWNGPYLKRSELLDTWDNPYDYRLDADAPNGEYLLISYGADGQPGGEEKNADIIND